MLSLFAVLFAFGTGIISAQSQTTGALTVNGTFTVPCGVTSVKIKAIGGGGAGGYISTGSTGSGGGGGGAYSEITLSNLDANQEFTYTVGAGGIATNGIANGSPSKVMSKGVFVLEANGGAGASGQTGGSGGSVITGASYTMRTGGNGAIGVKANQGKIAGGGGAAGSSLGNGGNASGSTSGKAVKDPLIKTYGGDGGDGGNTGVNGFIYGGGGGGSTSNELGANGAGGVVVFEYTTPPAPIISVQPSFTGSYCKGTQAQPLKVTATGANLTYQWYKSTNIAGSFEIVSVDGTSSSYTPSTVSAGTVYYYVKVTSNQCASINSDIVMVRVGADNVWDGTKWSETANSNMPGYTAVIAGPYNTANNGAINACNIRVNSNISFTVEGSNGATIQNDISNNGTITVKSGANLIQVNPVGQYTGAATSFIVEREAKALENNYPQKIDFVYWSSPVKAQTFAAFSPKAFAIREYLESSDRFTPTADASFVAAKGYSVWAETDKPGPYDKTYRFIGVPNNGDINIAVKLTANGYNLVGNPYPSNLNFDQLVADNSNTIYNVMYRWKTAGLTATPTNGSKAYVDTNYIVYTGTGSNVIGETGDISVGQGFIIQSKIAGVLNFKNSMRTTTAAKFYDKQVSARDRFWLQLTTPEKMENTLLIGYVDGATDGYDDDFDGESFTLSSDLFYSFLNKTRLIIQGKSPDFKTSDRILLGANLYGKGMHTISLAKAEGRFASSQKIYLKDNKTKTYTDLTAGSYTFDAEAGINDNRFEIVYVAGVLGTDIVTKSKLMVYKESNLLIVRGGKKMKGVEMYDASGRLVKNAPAASDSLEIPIDSFSSGFYILRVNYEDGTVQTKKVLK